MTREQALNEPLPWLKLLLEVSVQEQATDALMTMQAVLGGTAQGSLRDGGKVMDRIRRGLERQAGL